MIRLSRKLAVVSHVVPPATVGTAMRLSRLLRDISPDDYCLLTCVGRPDGKLDKAAAPGLPATHHRLPSEWRRIPRTRLPVLGPVAALVNLLLKTVQRARNIVKIVNAEQSEAILVVSGELADLPAAYIASRWVGIPLHVMLDDDYICQWPDRADRRFAAMVEPRVLKGAVSVIVLNDFLKDEYHRRYGVDGVIAYNPCESVPSLSTVERSWPAATGEIAIVFTGTVYHINYDTFRNLLTAIERVRVPGLKLHLYTWQSAEELESQGITGPVVFHSHISASQVLEVQRSADILFLPLGFNTQTPEVVRTSCPFKATDYLISGRPILVHAPRDTFLCWYFRKNECGIVVDDADPDRLADAITTICEDNERRRQITRNALQCAERDFSLAEVQKQFLGALTP